MVLDATWPPMCLAPTTEGRGAQPVQAAPSLDRAAVVVGCSSRKPVQDAQDSTELPLDQADCWIRTARSPVKGKSEMTR